MAGTSARTTNLSGGRDEDTSRLANEGTRLPEACDNKLKGWRCGVVGMRPASH